MGQFLNVVRALAGLTIPVVTTGPTPVAGEVSLYAKSDGNVYKKASDGSEVALGGGGSSSTPLSAWPVGSVYIGVVPTSPASLLGGGTWASFGTGQVLVGVDANQTEFNTVEKAGGSKSVVLSAGNLPPHAHTIAHTHDITRSSVDGTTSTTVKRAGTSDVAAPPTSGPSTPNSGNGPGTSDPVSVLQPYITVYMWKRTA